MNRKRLSLFFVPLCAAALLLAAGHASALGTVLWRVDTAQQFEQGELDQVVVTSEGEVKLGRSSTRIALSDVSGVWSLAEGPSGATYLGTGNNGQILKVTGNQVQKIAKTEAVVVSALAFGHGGDLFAGTLPGGKIYRIDPNKTGAKAKVFAELEKADHVWDLVYDSKRRVLFAATGPEGLIYALDGSGRADQFYDALDDHVLSLFLRSSGGLLAGTSPKARLLEIKGPGRGTALFDFDATEVKAITEQGEDIYVAVNTFPDPPGPPKTSSSKSKSSRRSARPKPGKGKVFRRGADGSVEPLLDFEEGHLTDIAAPGDGLVYAAAGAKGRVLTVDQERIVSTVVDVEERQVLALQLSGKSPVFATSDTGALYRLGKAAKGVAEYRSAALDATFVSSWGSLSWKGQGKLVVQTRSGNTKEPDQTWSDWSKAVASSGSSISSPSARYLQVRVRFSQDPSSVLRSLSIHHLPNNQRAVLTQVKVASPFEVSRPTTKTKAKSKSSSKRAKRPSKGPELEVSWKVDNPDNDELRYRIFFREESSKLWQSLVPEDEVLTETSYDWNTENVPAGHYVVKVQASDEIENPLKRALKHEKTTPPLVIDNGPPAITGLATKGRQISGTVSDGTSPVARIEYSIDGRAWHPVFPLDNIFDSRQEPFRFDLPPSLPAGPYTVAIRAHDWAQNQAVGRLSVVLR